MWLEVVGESIEKGHFSTRETGHGTIMLVKDQEDEALRSINFYIGPRFIPAFKAQFSIQTRLSNFLISYFYLFYSRKEVRNSAPMLAIKDTFRGRRLSEEDCTDPVQNFIALYLYTCISPGVVSGFEGAGGMLKRMIDTHQCDYKMYLPLMSRVSFSHLSQGLGNWQAVMTTQWLQHEQCRAIGNYEFGDFYSPLLTTKLVEKLSRDIPQSDRLLFRQALEKGIITADILKRLDQTAFSDPIVQESVRKYMTEYGQRVFDSIGQPNNKRLRLTFGEGEAGSTVLFFQTQKVEDDLLSPPFLSQEGNSMGTFPATILALGFGNFLFEIRAADKLGIFIKEVLRTHGVGNPRDFLQVPGNIGRDSQALMAALDLIYTRQSDTTYVNLVTKIEEFIHE